MSEWVLEVDENKNILEAKWVQELVRCRECIWWKTLKDVEGFNFCTYAIDASYVKSSIDYCSKGEKRRED